MAPTTTVFITGGNRGLGKGFVERFLARPNHIVIASTRDPESQSSKALLNLTKGEGSRLLIVKIDVTVEADHAKALKTLEEEGIDSLDIVIPNAGILDVHPFVHDVKIQDLQRHIDTNVNGFLYLYQATLPLLKKSPAPKWISMGSGLGSIGPPLPNSAYGPTKAMVSWYTKRINSEQEFLTALVIDPGWVATEMGNFGARKAGLERAPVDPDDSLNGIVSVIDKATKETHGGKFFTYEGEPQLW